MDQHISHASVMHAGFEGALTPAPGRPKTVLNSRLCADLHCTAAHLFGHPH